LLTEQKQDKRT